MKYIQCPINKISLSSRKDDQVIRNPSGSISYHKLDQLIQYTSHDLILRGIKKRAKVGLLCSNGLDFIVYYFALLRIEGIVCLLNTRWPSEVLNRELDELNLTFLISSKNLTKSKKIQHIKLSDQNKYIKQAQGQNLNVCRYNLENISNIMFTSGSGAFPKAVVHTIGNHYYSALGSNEHITLHTDDRWMFSLPAYHVSGLSILWRTILAGASIQTVNDKIDFVQNIIKFKPTHISLVPTQLIKCMRNVQCRKILSKMKSVLVGGSAIDPNLIKKAIEHQLPIYISYGLTEMSSQVATSKKIRELIDVNSVKVLKYRKLKIDSQGSILVKGETLFKGYYRRGNIKKMVDKSGWYKTGDLGEFSKKNGLKVLGRSDNMFISGGENIQPEQIEREILQQGSVEQVLVISVKDLTFGHRPVAFLKMAKGKRFSRKKLVDDLSLRIERYKIPDQFYYFPKEKVSSGIKVSRAELKKIIEKEPRMLTKAV
ncbi:MAG: o-succinylbenzoate--CoA ligase [Candidatus Omnitrophica bacterium]|nr:o-succinylbenzoate--CoA ligase [Candidatus Omnitrophota bacterium]